MKIEIYDEFYYVYRDIEIEKDQDGRAVYENDKLKIQKVHPYSVDKISLSDGYLFNGDGYTYPEGGWDYQGYIDYFLNDIDSGKPAKFDDGVSQIFEHDTYLFSDEEKALEKAKMLNALLNKEP